MKPGAFELDRVTKRYGEVAALRDMSFTIEPRQHTAIIGVSGSGKSTLLRLMAGLDAPSSGHVRLGGELLSEGDHILVPPHRRGVAMVFQDLALWPNLSIRDNVLLGLSGANLSDTARRERAAAALAGCQISDLADRTPGTLSGGQQQRAALARALAVEPEFLFLDEPFGGLDLLTKAALLQELKALVERHHMTIVLVAHDPSEALALCRRAIVIEDGIVDQVGDWSKVFADSRSELLHCFKKLMPSEK